MKLPCDCRAFCYSDCCGCYLSILALGAGFSSSSRVLPPFSPLLTLFVPFPVCLVASFLFGMNVRCFLRVWAFGIGLSVFCACLPGLKFRFSSFSAFFVLFPIAICYFIRWARSAFPFVCTFESQSNNNENISDLAVK